MEVERHIRYRQYRIKGTMGLYCGIHRPFVKKNKRARGRVCGLLDGVQYTGTLPVIDKYKYANPHFNLIHSTPLFTHFVFFSNLSHFTWHSQLKACIYC